MTIRLTSDALRPRCAADSFSFETTDDLEPLDVPLGQQRALAAVDLALRADQPGYNVFATGPSGTGKHDILRRHLQRIAADRPCPPELVYVHNFEQAREPRCLALPAGRGSQLAADVAQVIEELLAAIPAAFDSDEYRSRARQIREQLRDRGEEVFEEVEKEAERRGVAMLRMPSGVAFAPTRGGEVISPAAFAKLPKEQREETQKAMEELQATLKDRLSAVPRWSRDARRSLKELNSEVSEAAVAQALDEVVERYRDLDEVVAYFEALRRDVVEHAQEFVAQDDDDAPRLLEELRTDRFRRYEVNVAVDRSGVRGAPVIYEDRPSADQLVGRVEQRMHLGNLVTDHTMIKAGALHRANGGYLVVDAEKLLTQPHGWNTLKRALFAREVKIESVGRMIGLSAGSAIDPEPAPLEVKVVLIADRRLYHLLSAFDSEVADLFKVTADFTEVVERDPGTETAYARLLAELVRQRGLPAFDAGAVARVVDHGARLADDNRKLTLERRALGDLLVEAALAAGERGAEVVGAEDVTAAIAAQIRRQDRIRDRAMEMIADRTVLIDTEGEALGQVNGLSLRAFGSFSFGAPSRITATARIGKGDVVDIERESELGGKIHSKGVLILGSYFAQRYARDFPLALRGSLVFEQSYGGVDGDSASLAELCALISALSGVTVDQSKAVTGSVNQLGAVQAIGGVNDKIEGFFDVCRQRGLAGQGVIIPAANVPHLMLREDVVQACDEGLFNLWPVRHVDEAVELLLGEVAGTEDAEASFPAGSVNARVRERLRAFAVAAASFGKETAVPQEAVERLLLVR